MNGIVTDKLFNLGITPNLKGFVYLREGITIVVCDPEAINKMTGKEGLYANIANVYKTEPTRVERDIRHAIEVVFDKCGAEHLSDIFKHTVDPRRGKLTNSEFISVVSEIIRLEIDA